MRPNTHTFMIYEIKEVFSSIFGADNIVYSALHPTRKNKRILGNYWR